jgi:hypothetical protein
MINATIYNIKPNIILRYKKVSGSDYSYKIKIINIFHDLDNMENSLIDYKILESDNHLLATATCRFLSLFEIDPEYLAIEEFNEDLNKLLSE